MKPAGPVDAVAAQLSEALHEFRRDGAARKRLSFVKPPDCEKPGLDLVGTERQNKWVSILNVGHPTDLHAAQWQFPIPSCSRSDSRVGCDTVIGFPRIVRPWGGSSQ